jgi:hypothetical protein
MFGRIDSRQMLHAVRKIKAYGQIRAALAARRAPRQRGHDGSNAELGILNFNLFLPTRDFKVFHVTLYIVLP